MHLTQSSAFLLAGTLYFQLFNMDTTEAQPSGYNYDESKVPSYSLPDPLISQNGDKIVQPTGWTQSRRPEILSLFESEVYGRTPNGPFSRKTHILEGPTEALNGKAIRKQIRIAFGEENNSTSMDILLYLPINKEGAVPVFLGLNFFGNHTIHADPGIILSDKWMRNSDDKGVVNNRATEASRGTSASRWPVETILSRGYGLATIYCGDLDPDYHDEFKNGIHGVIDHDSEAGDNWSTIAAWSWGLSRALDYFETDPKVDHEKVAVLGHSRLGKTSLWAGASDERFAMVISNDSGCGGAALSRRQFGETVKRINTSFPHWFCRNFKKYNDREQDLPVDQHMLLALVAPRPLYVASAEEDLWADPMGEFLSLKHAEPVYLLLGTEGLGVDARPPVNVPVMKTMGYHIRSGKHDVTDFDWEQYLKFADLHFAP